jgi:pyrroline-5-carboxylate reductase
VRHFRGKGHGECGSLSLLTQYRDIATELAAQTCLGAAKMVLETGEHPALLKDAVTTPAGCTIDGLLTLEEGGLRVTLIKAVVESTRRAGELIGK